MKIAAGADHGGFALKQAVVRRLRSLGHEVIDVGTDSDEVSVDYPVYGHKVAELVASRRGRARRCSSAAPASASACRPTATRACAPPTASRPTSPRCRGATTTPTCCASAGACSARTRPGRSPRSGWTTPFEGGRHEHRVDAHRRGGALLEPRRPRVAARAALPPRPGAQRAAAQRAHPPAGDAGAHRQRELRQPRRPRGDRLGAHQQVRRGHCRARATTAAATSSTRSSSSPSTAARRSSAPSTSTCSRTPARRPTSRRSSRCSSPATRMMAMELAHGGHLTHGLGINYSGRTYNVVPVPRAPATPRPSTTTRCARWRSSTGPSSSSAATAPTRASSTSPRSARSPTSAAPCSGRHRPHRRPHRRRRAPQPGAVLRRGHEHHAQDAHRPARRHHHVPRGVRQGHRPRRVPRHAGRAAHARHRRQGGVPAASPRARSSTSLQRQIVANCAALAETLAEGGLRLVSGGTDVHLALVDLRGTGLNGLRVPGPAGAA